MPTRRHIATQTKSRMNAMVVAVLHGGNVCPPFLISLRPYPFMDICGFFGTDVSTLFGRRSSCANCHVFGISDPINAVSVAPDSLGAFREPWVGLNLYQRLRSEAASGAGSTFVRYSSHTYVSNRHGIAIATKTRSFTHCLSIKRCRRMCSANGTSI